MTDARGRPIAAYGLARWLSASAPRQAAGRAIAIALVPDEHSRRLNARFRGQNHATDVLSFPAGPMPGRRRTPKRPVEPRFLGDLAIARGVAARQARRLGHSLAVELRIVALHGLLHLLGYDHETDSGAMRRFEERLRRRARLPTGLVTRGTPDLSDRAR